MSLLRIGFITVLLSDALVSGYTAAAAFTIFVTQIKFVFGLRARDPTGFFTTPRVRGLHDAVLSLFSLCLSVCPGVMETKFIYDVDECIFGSLKV